MAFTLYEARVTNKLSQREVAEALDISVVTWRKYEVDNPKKISFELIELFLNLVDLELTDLDFNRV